ncbi:MAG: hypothetical protein AB1345_01955 [Chloroflexota bacterium]
MSRNLYIEPALLGLEHEFSFEGYSIAISLPTSKDIPSEDELFKTPQDDYRLFRISYNTWKEVNGHKIPVAYWIHSVDVKIKLVDTLSIPEDMLPRHPNAYNLITKEQQDHLNALADEYGQIAEKAFDLWVRIMRWKCDNSSIGRPEIRGVNSGWGTYLLEASSENRIWRGETVIRFHRSKPVTKKEWNEVQVALQEGQTSPIYYDLMFDAVEHMKIGDLQRSVVDLAISCESLLRKIVTQNLPIGLNDAMTNYISNAKINWFLDKFFPQILQPPNALIFSNMKGKLKDLFQARNDIVHSRKPVLITLNECGEFIKVTKELILLGSGYLGDNGG